jgi:signal peptidase I
MRDPSETAAAGGPLDGRIMVYRIVKWFLLVLLAAFIVKLFFFDIILIRTDQMAPTLMDGDRVLVLRAFCVWPLSRFIVPMRKCPVIIENKQLFDVPACLRVAARSGDSVCVSSGKLIILNKPSVTFASKASYVDLLPPDYSPRDSMPLFVMPKKGMTVQLDSLPARDFFFAASLIRQENPQLPFSVKPELFIDGAPAGSFALSDFYLYKGNIDSVPSQHEFDWFFWDRVQDYLVHSLPGKDVYLGFSLLQGSTKLYRYAFKRSCIFLCADDWQKGYDSRFFGPVLSSCVKGRVLCVVWSYGKDQDNKTSLRIERLFKIIK